ncbi:putative family protein [Phaeomoniella chlamydospora]|uniref:Putative family protein n=1 Tax=Phaeomoniella chlamydospora TaxID=158046 RepID=A0A0G2GNG1_PHACM|nr:putative family protein [Phaeomoniella chlamydospora]
MVGSLATKYEINSDMGEGFGRWKMGPDAELMKIIDAANIACGFHAGDPSIMLNTIRMCKANGVKAGAHPGLQDLFGFGRRKIEIDPKDMYAMILYQVGALKAMLDAEGVELNHIKPHGELFFYMLRDHTIMRAVLEACATFKVPVYGAKNEAEKNMCAELGIPFQEEIYVDVDYTAEGNLVPVAQSKPSSSELCYKRVQQVVKTDHIWDTNDKEVKLGFNGAPFSVCIHSDNPNALANAEGTRKAVDEANAAKSQSNGSH